MKRRPAKKVSPAIKTYVKRAIATNQENKLWIQYGANQAITTTSGGVPTFQNLVPTLSQGSQNGNRIGNQIHVKRGYIRGYVNLLPYNVANNPLIGPLMVKMWLVRAKTPMSSNLAETNIATNFFDIQNSVTGFQGTMLDMVLSENRDEFTVLQSKKFELGLTSSTSVATALPVNLDNSKFTVPFYFSYGKYLKKKLRYRDNTANAPATNTNLFLVFQAVYANGDNTAVQAAEYHFNTRVEFEDA